MSYLYGELPSRTKTTLATHLASCPACQKNVADWQSAMKALDTWELPLRPARLAALHSALKWGIAALFVLGFGYGLGRFSMPASNLETLRAGIERSVRTSLEKEFRQRVRNDLDQELRSMLATCQQQLTNRLRQAYVDMNGLAEKTLVASAEQTGRLLAAYDEKRQEQQQATWTALNTLDTRQRRIAAEYASFRREVETLAVLTEKNFEQVLPVSFGGSVDEGRNQP